MSSLNPSAPSGACIGIEIGGTKLQVVVGDRSLRIVHRWRGRVDKSAGAAGIRAQIESALAEILPSSRAAAIGVGFGGPVNWSTGTIDRSHHIEGWMGFPLLDWLTSLTKLPVVVDNDANVAALGEAVAGAATGTHLVFYANFGSGVGGGMVIDQRIYHGAAPGECEFGHLRLDRGPTTVESRCSGWAVDRRIRDAISSHPNSVLARLIAGATGGEARHLSEALRQNDPTAREILDQVSEDLGYTLSHVVHLLHPQIIVLGGGLSLVGEALRESVTKQLPRFVMQAFQPVPPIRLAQLGEDAVPVGALRLALDHAPRA